MVDDLEGSARKILDYIGVEWQSEVLKFNELGTGDDCAVGSDKGGQFFLLRSFHSIVLSVSVAPCATLNSIPIEYHGSNTHVKSSVTVSCCGRRG